jgi:hypothetical protein
LTEDFLSWRIERRLKWTEQSEKVIVFRPRFGESRFGKKFADLVGLNDYRIRLDEVGSVVWRHCDGETPVRSIVEALREHFGEKVEPADQRLKTFISQMQSSKMIEVLKPSQGDDQTNRTIRLPYTNDY